MPVNVERSGPAERRAIVRAPQSLIGGLCLLALAALALYLTKDLSQGSLRAMGPAMLPRWLAVGVGLCGLALVAIGFLSDGDPLERWSLRGPIFVVAAILAFALSIRTVGLALAGPLTILISGLASNETRWKETVIFSIVMTLFCIGLFRFALNQPMPILIIPGIIYL
jgi:putative tricarboxylic transport membrane protein